MLIKGHLRAWTVTQTRNQLCTSSKQITDSSKIRENHSVCEEKTENYIKLKAKPPWDIIFFGTDEFAVTSLQSLHKEQKRGVVGHLGVVSVSTKKTTHAVGRYCRQEGLPLQNWPIDVLHGIYDLGIVVSFGHLIPAAVINAFPLGILNVHGSLLPRWRGGAPIIHALLNNDTVTGITIMKIEPKRFDVGKIVSQVAVPIPWDIKHGELSQHMAQVGAQELLSVLQDLPRYLKSAKLQPQEGITKAPLVSAATSRVHWDRYTCSNIQARYRALDDNFPLWTLWHGKPVKLRNMVMQQQWSCHQMDNKDDKSKITEKCDTIKQHLKNNSEQGNTTQKKIDANTVQNIQKESMLTVHERNFLPGSVMFHKKRKVVRVRCADGWVDFLTVVVKGHKTMSAQDFNNGFLCKVSKDCHKFE